MSKLYKDGYTELHFQARYGSPFEVLELLRRGETLALKNHYGTLPLGDIYPEILETHLDECITSDFNPFNNADPNDIIKEHTDVKINYRSLLPLECTTQDKKHEDEVKELDAVLESAIKDNEDKAEVKELDVVVESTIKDKKVKVKELDVVEHISKSSQLQHLLKHPVIKSFIDLKWLQYRWLLYINVTHSALLCLFLMLWKQLDITNNYALYAITASAILVELYDLVMSPKEYFRTLKNYVDLFLIAGTIYIILGKDVGSERVSLITATVVLLSALESLLFLGLFPKFSKYALMLLKVGLSFVKFFMYYFIFVLAFAFCFYSLFKKNDDPSNDHGYQTIWHAIFKTLVMLTGEYNTNDLVYEPYPVASRIILIVYILTMSIVLMNLLNGLAVSDIQKIENEAELLSITAKVNYMVHINNYYNVQRVFARGIVFLSNILPHQFLGSSKLYKSAIYEIELRLNYNALHTDKAQIVKINGVPLGRDHVHMTSGNTISNIELLLKKKRLAMFSQQLTCDIGGTT